MFFLQNKFDISNDRCPITQELIRDLVRENPSSVVVFQHPQNKLCFAYDKTALRAWFKPIVEEMLARRSNAPHIILRDLLTTIPLPALEYNKSLLEPNKSFLFPDIELPFLYSAMAFITIPMLIGCILSFLDKEYSINPESYGVSRAQIRSFIFDFYFPGVNLCGYLMGGYMALGIINITGTKLMSFLRHELKDLGSEKIFNDWFEKTFVKFDPTRHKLPLESLDNTADAEEEIMSYPKF